MQLAKIRYKKLIPVLFALGICLFPILRPTVLSVEGHGWFGATGLWDRIRAIYPTGKRPVELQAVTRFKERLAAEGRDLNVHSIYVETLDTREPLVAFNENTLLNPASVMKVVTSIAALDKLGANYQFQTQFYASGEINRQTGELAGDLVVVGGGDPAFSVADARTAGETLRKLGVRQVRGRLIVSGHFSCNENTKSEISAAVLRKNLGISFGSQSFLYTYAPDNIPGTKLFTIVSDKLMHILQEQNAHSINPMADALGEFIGGPEAVRKFLIERVGLKENEVLISRTSGLEVNRLTAWGTTKMLRGSIEWLQLNGYKPEDLMPIAGIDSSTVGGRFTEADFAGSVVAKTGTLHETDNGASNLAGIAYTKSKGAILFVIYNMAESRKVISLRGVQDEFLKNLMNEFGGADPVFRRTSPPAEIKNGRVVLAE